MTCDGGPDENHRYQKNISTSIDYFCTFDLDALFVATNASGRSAFNTVERRMAPLSHELAGVILPHANFGTHLDSQSNTVNSDLEIKIVGHAGKVLAEIWSSTVIDNHPVVAEYVNHIDHQTLIEKSQQWCQLHERESQYMLQIIKCKHLSCCTPPRSSNFSFVKDRFLPPPKPLAQSDDGLVADIKKQQFASLFVTIQLGTGVFLVRIPYDYGCPSLQEVLSKRMSVRTLLSYFGLTD